MNVDLIRAPRKETSTAEPIRERIRAFSLTACVVIVFTVWLGLEAPRGMMWGTDELLTAERSRETMMNGPWVVNYNFQRSFEKPPLQYWLTGFTLKRFENRAVAVRIWAIVYGVLTAAALAWLVLLIKPNEPWLIPLAVTILLSDPLFSTECARGLLDVGLTFYTVLTIAFAELARKKPAWWLGAAIACWLGSLQKVPVPILIWALIVLSRLTSRDERAALRVGARWLAGSTILALALMSIWPLLQILKYQMSVGDFIYEEVIVWLGPAELGRRPYFKVLFDMVTHPGGLCGFLSLIALVVILLSRRERSQPAVREIAFVSLMALILVIVSNFRDIRYLIPIVPSLCFLLALVVYRFLKQPPPVRTYAAVALAILLTAGFVHAKIHIDNRRRNVADEKVIAEKLGELQQAGARTVLIKAIVPGDDLLWESFYLFYGNFRFPVIQLTTDEIRARRPKPPLSGACVGRDFPVVKELYPNVQVQLRRAQFVCWSVPAE